MCGIAMGSIISKLVKRIAKVTRALLIVCLSASAVSASDSSAPISPIEQLHFVEESNWPPFTFQKFGKAESGLSLDIMQAVFSQLGIAVDISLYPQRRVLLNVQKGYFDGVTMISKNAERARYLTFSDPVIGKLGRLYYREDRESAIEWNSFDDLRGLTIGITRGHNYGEDFEAARARGDVKVVEVTRVEQSFYLLVAGRVDAVLCIDITANHILKQNDFTNKLVAAQKPYYEGSYHIAFASQGQAVRLMPEVNKVIAAMKASGEFDAILANYR
jgi:polar amino acid transport system substrate-binding protein